MSNERWESVVEALLFVSDRPLGLREIGEVLKEGYSGVTAEDIRHALAGLAAELEKSGRSFQVHEDVLGFQLKTLPPFAPFIRRLFKEEMTDRLSIPALETLAIVAYKQPVTRAEVEAIRGVNIDGMIKTLTDKDLIQIVGKKDVPGKPTLMGTTKQFLVHFGLKELGDLPNMEEFKEALVARERHLEQHREAAGTAGAAEVSADREPAQQQKEEVHETT